MNHPERIARPGRFVTIMTGVLAAVLLIPPGPARSVAAVDAAAAPSAAAPSLKVDEIVARHLEARGGLDRIRSIKSMREHGLITAGPHRQAVVTRERKRPGFTRFELTLQGVTSVIASDGRHGWKMSPLEGDLEPQPLPIEVVKEASEQADIDGPLVDWKAKGHRIELTGHEMIDGRDAYRIQVTLESGAVLDDYIDVETFNRVRSDSTRQVRGRPVRLETTFGDHRMTGGVLFPHLIEIEAAGRPEPTRIVIDSIDINPKLSDERFAMPETGD